MEIRFNVTGADRKKLVESFSEIVGCKSVYMKAPSFAYKIGNYVIDKDGTLIFEERASQEDVENLLTALAEQGFVSNVYVNAEESNVEASAEIDHSTNTLASEASVDSEIVLDTIADIPADTYGEAAHAEDSLDSLVIEMPMDGFSVTALDNLDKLVASKAALIMKSIGTDSLSVEREDGRLRFPWFSPAASSEEIGAYTQFIHALCEIAKNQKRVTAKEKPAESEKFAFRCFLLRLGFIGSEYAAARKILLRKLSGDSSFKNSKRKDRGDSVTAPVAVNAADSAVMPVVESNADEHELVAYSATTAADMG